jgi:hypothetical protein
MVYKRFFLGLRSLGVVGLVLCVFTIGKSICTGDYKTLNTHSQMFYALLEDYVTTHSTDNASNVVEFINSEKTKATFKDAAASSYSRSQLLFSTYQYSFSTTPKREVIIEALCECVAADHTLQQAVFWGTWGCVGWSFLSMLYMIRATYRYLKRDNPLLSFYERNDPAWLRSNRGVTSPLMTNPSPNPFGEPNIS